MQRTIRAKGNHSSYPNLLIVNLYLRDTRTKPRDELSLGFIIYHLLVAYAGGTALSTRCLLCLAVQPMLATARAELVQLHACRVVALVLGACVVSLLALCTRQIDDDAVGFLCHFFSPDPRSEKLYLTSQDSFLQITL